MGKKITEEDMRLNFIFNAESGKKDLLEAEKQLQVLINKQEKWNDQIKERGWDRYMNMVLRIETVRKTFCNLLSIK
jgi:uncharacterized protein YifE (UPF0438 family)